jgi:hypothetical protein
MVLFSKNEYRMEVFTPFNKKKTVSFFIIGVYKKLIGVKLLITFSIVKYFLYNSIFFSISFLI